VQQRAAGPQGQRVWLQALGLSRFKAVEVRASGAAIALCTVRRYRAERAQVWLHSDSSTLPPCGTEKFKEDMDGALDDLSSARLEGGNSIICKNCSHWLQ
jgi:hypothetical protein